MAPLNKQTKELISDVSGFAEKNDEEKNALLLKIFENLSQGNIDKINAGDQILNLFRGFQNSPLEDELQRDNFSLLIDIAAEATRKCPENKRLFSSDDNLVKIILDRLPDFEDVSQQQVPGVELLFRICPSADEKKDAFLSKFKIDNRLIDRFKKINSKNFMRESRVFLVMLNNPFGRLYPQIVGAKKIAVSLGEGVFKDISTEPFPLDLNRNGFFVPAKDERAELDLPFDKMMRWRIKDQNGDRILEIQMTKDWALQNSGYLSVVFTLKEDTYSNIAKLLENNGVEFMSHKASFAQQPVTSTLESSSGGKISDRHKNETWKAIGKVSSAEEAELIEKEATIEKKKPKPKIMVSEDKLDLSTSSPLFEESEAKIPVTTLMDMPVAPIAASLNDSTESVAISAPTAGQKEAEKYLEPEVIVMVPATSEPSPVEAKKAKKPASSKKPWMEAKFEENLDEDESFAKDLLAQLIPDTKMKPVEKPIAKKEKKPFQKKGVAREKEKNIEVSKRDKRKTRRSDLDKLDIKPEPIVLKESKTAESSKKLRSSIVSSKSSSTSDVVSEGLKVFRSDDKKPDIVAKASRTGEKVLRSDISEKDVIKKKRTRQEAFEFESTQKRTAKKSILSPSREDKTQVEDIHKRRLSIASTSGMLKKPSALQRLIGKAKGVTPPPPQETPAAKDRINQIYSINDFSPLKIHMPSPISQAESFSSPIQDHSTSLAPLIKKVSQVYESYCNNTIKMVHERLKSELAPMKIENQVRSTIKRRVDLALQYESFLNQVSSRLEKLEEHYL